VWSRRRNCRQHKKGCRRSTRERRPLDSFFGHSLGAPFDSSQVLLMPLWLAMSEHNVRVEWWSRSGSNRRPLECHPISGRDYSLPTTVIPKKLRTNAFHQLGDVSTWLRVFSDKRRTVIEFVRLIRSQQGQLNRSNLRPFFFSVRELSVSFKRGDGNEKSRISRSRDRKVSLVWTCAL
jgi:hypothetical protein